MSDTPKTIRQEWRDMKRERDEARASLEKSREAYHMACEQRNSFRRERDVARAQVAALQDALRDVQRWTSETDSPTDWTDADVIGSVHERSTEALALVEDT